MPRLTAQDYIEKARNEFEPEFHVFLEVFHYSAVTEEQIARAFFAGGSKAPREKRYDLYRKIAKWLSWPVRCQIPAALEASIKYIYPEANSEHYVGFIPAPRDDRYTRVAVEPHHKAVLEMIASRQYDLNFNPAASVASSEYLQAEAEAGGFGRNADGQDDETAGEEEHCSYGEEEEEMIDEEEEEREREEVEDEYYRLTGKHAHVEEEQDMEEEEDDEDEDR